MKVLIVDVETTGLDLKSDGLCEIGAVLYDTDKGALCELSFIVASTRPPAEVTGIEPGIELSLGLGASALQMWESVQMEADIYAAHNAPFDRGFLSTSITYGKMLGDKPWVCTMRDVAWPKSKPTNLASIALAHGLGVATAHRALADCRLLSRLFDVMRAQGVLGEMLAAAMVPRSTFAASVRYEDRDKAKDAGFTWEPSRKRWTKRMSDDEAAVCSLLIERVEA